MRLDPTQPAFSMRSCLRIHVQNRLSEIRSFFLQAVRCRLRQERAASSDLPDSISRSLDMSRPQHLPDSAPAAPGLSDKGIQDGADRADALFHFQLLPIKLLMLQLRIEEIVEVLGVSGSFWQAVSKSGNASSILPLSIWFNASRVRRWAFVEEHPFKRRTRRMMVMPTYFIAPILSVQSPGLARGKDW